MLDGIGKPLDVVLLLDVSDEVSLERLLGRRTLQPQRRCARGDPEPPAPLRLTEPVVERYRTKGMLVPSTASSPSTTSCERSGTPSRRWERRGRVIRKSEREIEKIAAAGDLVAETIAHVGARVGAGHHHGRARRDRRGVHPQPRQHPDPLRSATAATGPFPESDLHLAERGRSPRHLARTGSPGASSRSTSVSRSTRTSRTAYTFGVREIAPRRSACSRSRRRRSRPGSARRASTTALGTSARGASRGRGRRVLGRQEPRRPRGRPPLPREPAHPELRPAQARPAALRGDDDRDRADDHDGRCRRSRSPATADHRDRPVGRSAHFEHTVAITADGPRILTPRVGLPGGVRVFDSVPVVGRVRPRGATLAEVAQHHAFGAVEPRVEPVERCVHAIERARSTRACTPVNAASAETIVAACAPP